MTSGGNRQRHGGRDRPERLELRPLATLPPRTRLILAALGLAMAAFLVYWTLHVIATERPATAILLIVTSYLGFAVLTVAVLTVTRAMFSLGSVPFLLGRWIFRRLLRR